MYVDTTGEARATIVNSYDGNGTDQIRAYAQIQGINDDGSLNRLLPEGGSFPVLHASQTPIAMLYDAPRGLLWTALITQNASPIVDVLRDDGTLYSTTISSYTETNGGITLDWKLDASSGAVLMLLDGTLYSMKWYSSGIQVAEPIATPGWCANGGGLAAKLHIYPNNDRVLIPCIATSPTWLFARTRISLLLVNQVTQDDWRPFVLAGVCDRILSSIQDDVSGTIYAQCNTNTFSVTSDFQCAPGEMWFGGSCSTCPLATAKLAPSDGFNSSIVVLPACTSCAAGSIAPTMASVTCQLCAAGSMHDLSLGQVCVECPVGRYSSTPGLTACRRCPPGTIASSVGSTSCSSCALGSVPDSTASTCTPCEKGLRIHATMRAGCVRRGCDFHRCVSALLS
jgi:hypothetical protein